MAREKPVAGKKAGGKKAGGGKVTSLCPGVTPGAAPAVCRNALHPNRSLLLSTIGLAGVQAGLWAEAMQRHARDARRVDRTDAPQSTSINQPHSCQLNK
eukprot:3251346-Prymnesium_polylepis.2